MHCQPGAIRLDLMAHPARPRSPLWMVVLSLVCEEPMHPYRMQTLIKERGKDEIANVAQRNSVYQTIAALRRAGLIVARGTSREERRPERTVYEVTEEGRRTLQSWMRTVLSTPAREFPDFPAALSLVAGAEPDEVRALLEARVRALEMRLAELERPVPNLPRLFLLENEYMAALVRAEIKWLRAVTADLRSGQLTWSDAWLRRIAAELAAPVGQPSPRDASPARSVANATIDKKRRQGKRAAAHATRRQRRNTTR
jgi:DNA-binding PadR family transcriptional regulator